MTITYDTPTFWETLAPLMPLFLTVVLGLGFLTLGLLVVGNVFAFKTDTLYPEAKSTDETAEGEHIRSLLKTHERFMFAATITLTAGIAALILFAFQFSQVTMNSVAEPAAEAVQKEVAAVYGIHLTDTQARTLATGDMGIIISPTGKEHDNYELYSSTEVFVPGAGNKTVAILQHGKETALVYVKPKTQPDSFKSNPPVLGSVPEKSK